ncbi:MAG: GAF domain-containing protein, partial [Candidatus Omnitrophica bacterium]|nr:GAF domain-containing protein [Candidatus Omnitrophota bacterium]
MLLYNTTASSHYLIFWNGLVITAIPLAVVTYYHFVRAYNNKTTGKGVYIGYAMVSTIFVLSLMGYVVKDAYFIDNLLYHDIAPWDYIIAAILIPFLTLIILMLRKRFYSSVDPVDRNRTSYLIVGWSLLVVISYITPFTPALKTLPIDHIGNLINALIISYAIFKFNLLNIQIIFRKVLTYTIVIVALFGITTALVFLSSGFLIGLPTISRIIIISSMAILIGILARPSIQFVAKIIDYLFFRKTYDYRRDLLEFNRKMRHILNLDELAHEILPAMAKAINTTSASLILQDSSTGNFETQYTYPVENIQENEVEINKLNFDADSSIIHWMDKKGSPLNPNQIDTIPEFRGLWQSEKEKIDNSNIGLLYPFKSRDKLIGIFALGKKKNNSIFSHEDIELITSIANQAGVIIENAQLY